MNDRLRELIELYQAKVRQAIGLMQQHLGLRAPQDELEWLMESGIPPQGYFGHTQQYHYWLHDTSCDVELEGMTVAWDFDPIGQWQGIDPWKLADFVDFNRLDYAEYADPHAIIAALDEALSRGEMENRNNFYYLRHAQLYQL